MTTLEAATQIAAALNADDFSAKVWNRGSDVRVYVKLEGRECGYIAVGTRRPFDTITKHGGQISLVAERAVKLTGSRAVDLEPLPEQPPKQRYHATPRDENEAQAREDGDVWVDQYGHRHHPGT